MVGNNGYDYLPFRSILGLVSDWIAGVFMLLTDMGFARQILPVGRRQPN